MELFDCVITYGELDPKWYGHYKEGFKTEIVKHAVSQQEAQAWNGSLECLKRVQELERLGREKFGKDYWMKWNVSHFWTTAVKDSCQIPEAGNTAGNTTHPVAQGA